MSKWLGRFFGPDAAPRPTRGASIDQWARIGVRVFAPGAPVDEVVAEAIRAYNRPSPHDPFAQLAFLAFQKYIGAPATKCGACGGTGLHQSADPDDLMGPPQPCEVCGGTGLVDNTKVIERATRHLIALAAQLDSRVGVTFYA